MYIYKEKYKKQKEAIVKIQAGIYNEKKYFCYYNYWFHPFYSYIINYFYIIYYYLKKNSC